jgi:hypothetical protein
MPHVVYVIHSYMFQVHTTFFVQTHTLICVFRKSFMTEIHIDKILNYNTIYCCNFIQYIF